MPVYARPADLVTARLREFRDSLPAEGITGRVADGRLVPFFSRREIQEAGALEGRGLEIAWVEDRLDLFIVEVQGSGAIRFPDGGEVRIGYAGSNGHPYRKHRPAVDRRGEGPAGADVHAGDPDVPGGAPGPGVADAEPQCVVRVLPPAGHAAGGLPGGA